MFEFGEEDKPDNYRSIPILRVIRKIYEKIVCNHFELLRPPHFGFRRNMLTSEAVLNTLQYICMIT